MLRVNSPRATANTDVMRKPLRATMASNAPIASASARQMVRTYAAIQFVAGGALTAKRASSATTHARISSTRQGGALQQQHQRGKHQVELFLHRQ